MRVIGKPKLQAFKLKHPDASSQVDEWLAEAEETRWQTPQDIKRRYGSASILAGNHVIFNIKGNKYRLKAQVSYKSGIVMIVIAGTHQEYMRW